MTLPLFARKFIVDFVETALAAVFAISVAFPATPGDLKALGAAAGIGVIGAAISSARRAVPGLLLWLNAKLNVPADGSDDT